MDFVKQKEQESTIPFEFETETKEGDRVDKDNRTRIIKYLKKLSKLVQVKTQEERNAWNFSMNIYFNWILKEDHTNIILLFLNEMKENNIKLNLKFYNLLINSFIQQHYYDEAYKYLQKLESENFESSDEKQIYMTLLHKYSNVGNYTRCLQLLDRIKKQGKN